MGDGTADKLKGHGKEAAGELTDDDGLKREGKVDRALGRAEGQDRRRLRQAQGRRQPRPRLTQPRGRAAVSAAARRATYPARSAARWS